MLDVVERVGNSVPHPVVIFVMLIGFIIVLSHIVLLTIVVSLITEKIVEPRLGEYTGERPG